MSVVMQVLRFFPYVTGHQKVLTSSIDYHNGRHVSTDPPSLPH